MKKRLIFLLCFSVSLIINIIPLFVFKEKVAFSNVSYYPLIVMVVLSAHGLLCYFCRHSGNYLLYVRTRWGMFGSDQDYTFEKEYSREFYWQFIVYCFAMPFYIPCVFFSTKFVHLLWTMCVFVALPLVYFINDMVKYFKDIKEKRKKSLKREQELKKQKEREELGYFE